MFGWLREFLEIRHESRERRIRLIQEASEKRCESCEVLKIQLERANIEKDKLLSKLLDKPSESIENKPVEITPPKQIPWAVRRQMLEQEDRRKAQLMRDSPKPDKVDIQDLENELGIVEKERQNG